MGRIKITCVAEVKNRTKEETVQQMRWKGNNIFWLERLLGKRMLTNDLVKNIRWSKLLQAI
jgi:hypothetical protein